MEMKPTSGTKRGVSLPVVIAAILAGEVLVAVVLGRLLLPGKF